mmetsp:Transcript_22044/g.33936  ORF Transcript_22044/g.33936 Transcript_22044/m.33936 type:complete len:93 (+) Transcript_22044:190-468(+)
MVFKHMSLFNVQDEIIKENQGFIIKGVWVSINASQNLSSVGHCAFILKPICGFCVSRNNCRVQYRQHWSNQMLLEIQQGYTQACVVLDPPWF